MSGSPGQREQANQQRRQAQRQPPREQTGNLSPAALGCWRISVSAGGLSWHGWPASKAYRRGCGACTGRPSFLESRCVPSGLTTVSQYTHSMGPKRRPGRSDCARRFGAQEFLQCPVSETLSAATLGGAPTCASIVDPRNVIHASDDEERGIWRPCEIVYFGPQRPTHVLCPPCLLVIQAFGAEGWVVGFRPDP
jgi:hypothetical protein